MSSITSSIQSLNSPNIQQLEWSQITPTQVAMELANLSNEHRRPYVVLCPDHQTCFQLEEDLLFFLKGKTDRPEVLVFPDWETLPYDHFSPHEDIISQRLATLATLPHKKNVIVLVAVSTAMHRCAPVSYTEQFSLQLRVGDTLELTRFRDALQQACYHSVSQVMEHGEFTIRGSIIDIYPMGHSQPYRIDLFDNEIDSIRPFDPETQLSQGKIESIDCLPAREFPLTEEAITQFRRSWRDAFPGKATQCPLYEQVTEGIAPQGIEYYLPLFFTESANLTDYLPKDSIIVIVNHCFQMAEHFWGEVKQRHEQYAYDITRPILPPGELYLAANELFHLFKKFHVISTATAPGGNNFNFQPLPDIAIDSQRKQPLSKLQTFLEDYSGRILFCAESAGRREVLAELFQQLNDSIHFVSDFSDFKEQNVRCAICIAPLQSSYIDNAQDIAIISEAQLFDQHVMQQRRRRRARDYNPDVIIRNLAELCIGDAVVHIEHGVGRYQGLQTLDINNQVNEFLTITYQGGDKIYVPVTSLDVISRHSGADSLNAPLYKLGSEHWKKEKRKAEGKAKDVAAELLLIYAEREAKKGTAFTIPAIEYPNFVAQFPFQETLDQENAIANVIEDMTQARPMDRLICGDVGFGKTEVAMRAAFIATQNGKQVAILVPTTLLATQHHENFVDRFADFAIKIECLSRFQTAKDITETLKKIAEHKVDIIIGTHRLIQKDVSFSDLGLLIIDEEHRFGVRQKEHLKSLRSSVDILSLTATPIPRTLNMSMSGMREISIIGTPPAKRLSIKTFLHERNNSIIKESVLREILRGGQVFFLHNNVKTIERTAHELGKLLPDAKIAVAHGQMRERQLETVMRDFYHQRYNVLICTTIIETGIDIPTANTIIIDRADRFGLAQLHQLRGRVGRSHHQAYAYLMVPNKKSITADAKKRLEAFLALDDLGAGFNLASHDLEIRGCGELLGDEQSGHIQQIGYTLYMDMLNRAVKALQNKDSIDADIITGSVTDVDLHVSAIIPEQYIPDVQHRLVIYKRLSSCENKEALHELQVELIDRYGLLPDLTKELFRIAQLKLKLVKLGVKKVDVSSKRGRIVFHDKHHVDPAKLIQLIQRQSDRYQLDGPNALRINRVAENIEARYKIVYDFLDAVG